MKKIILTVAVASLLGLSGCATTPQKPLTFDQLGQFSQIPLNSHTYRISFTARPNMSYGTAEEIALVQAAQTTVQNGFHFFKVLNDPSNQIQQPPRQAVVYPAPAYYGPYYGYRRYPFWPDPFYDMPQVVNVEPAQVAYTIECYKDQKTAPEDAFDALLILKSIGQKYGVGLNGQILQPEPPSVTTP